MARLRVDFLAAFDSVVDPGVCAGNLRTLKPSMTEELLTLTHHALMEFSLVPGVRELETPQLYGLRTRFAGGNKHRIPPPMLDVETAHLVLVGDSMVFTMKDKGKNKEWHGQLKKHPVLEPSWHRPLGSGSL